MACELRPLKVWAFQEVLEAWEGQRQPSAPEGEKPLPAPIKGTPLMTVARRILPEHACCFRAFWHFLAKWKIVAGIERPRRTRFGLHESQLEKAHLEIDDVLAATALYRRH
ncbi:MAG: hypothetical protein V3S64_00890, partial [bacterium]